MSTIKSQALKLAFHVPLWNLDRFALPAGFHIQKDAGWKGDLGGFLRGQHLWELKVAISSTLRSVVRFRGISLTT